MSLSFSVYKAVSGLIIAKV